MAARVQNNVENNNYVISRTTRAYCFYSYNKMERDESARRRPLRILSRGDLNALFSSPLGGPKWRREEGWPRTDTRTVHYVTKTRTRKRWKQMGKARANVDTFGNADRSAWRELNDRINYTNAAQLIGLSCTECGCTMSAPRYRIDILI